MIKQEDLRIGDLVRTSHKCAYPKGTVFAVTEIRHRTSDGHGVAILSAINNKDYGPVGVLTRNIEGIPLTPEILKNNGFDMKDDSVVYAKIKVGLKPLHDNKGYEAAIGYRFFYLKIGDIQYVHELQHILWVLGYDTELKIK